MTEPARRRLPVRPLLLVAVVVGSIAVARATGVADSLTLVELQALVSDAGPAAIPVYWAVFLAAVALTVPGYPFVVLGVLVFGAPVGVPVALAGAGLSGTLVTAGYRAIGGSPTAAPRWRVVQRGLDLVDRRPVLGIALLRSVLMISGPANLLLALAGVRPLHNLLGTVLGLVPATLLAAVAVDLLVAFFGGAA
jgi:uncharacterized membrane protein YdjX (TVP38/TMEM64 family)